MDDDRIVELYLHREESAIAYTQDKYGTRLRALALGIVKDAQTAEECENDTYWGAWNAIPPHEPRTYLYAFLARITRNAALNCCRNRSRLKRGGFVAELSREMEQCISAPDDTQCRMEEIELREAINGFLGTLSTEKRNVFLRRYWYCDATASIAKRYGISESKVKTMLYRVRNQLKLYLLKEGYIL
ncbi:MAG: RNA polymerase sigma factor [Faecousia sp.]